MRTRMDAKSHLSIEWMAMASFIPIQFSSWHLHPQFELDLITMFLYQLWMRNCVEWCGVM